VTERRASPSAEYELTIDNGLGPVLRAVLGPELVARTRTCTTFVAESSGDVDALVGRLPAWGRRIESVVVDPPAPTIGP